MIQVRMWNPDLHPFVVILYEGTSIKRACELALWCGARVVYLRTGKTVFNARAIK